MECSACGTRLPEGASFCHACGAAQAAPSCTQCRADLLPGAAFCSACGTPTTGAAARRQPGVAPGDPVIAAEGAAPVTAGASERRLTSVLFADLVSYTSLSEQRDTEDVRELLTAYFETCSTVIRRYGGTVEKFIGDAVMAVWGVPAAHEDDAERAVRAALELVTEVAALGERLEIPQLALRAGVVTGEVTATIGAHDQGMVAGDPVNTAARVQTAAASGEVWVDANTRALTASAVTYRDVGEHQLKGKIEPVPLYRALTVVAGMGGLQRVDGLEAPLTGRDRELRFLKELFHATEESGRPRLVVLDGEAGIGKTRLSWEFEKYVDGLRTTTRWHRTRCPSYGDRVAFWALAEAVRGRLGLGGDEQGEPGDRLDAVLAEFVSDEQEALWLRPRVGSLLGEPGDFTREDLFSAWVRFFERVGGDDPLVLLIDDAHCADTGLLDFIEHLLGSARAAVFVLLLARPELLEARPDLGGRRATVVHLEPITAATMGQLVDGLVEGLPEDTREALVDRAGGIPLFAVETVRALIDRDLVVPRDGRYQVAGDHGVDLSEVAAPASLQALIAARLDALSPDERRVVADASVLGSLVTREGLDLLGHGAAHLDEVLLSLQRKEILVRDTDRLSAERGQLRFVQTVVRQVAYSTLARRDRKARHLLVARHLSDQDDQAGDLAMVVAQHLIDAIDAAHADDPDLPELRERVSRLLVVAGDRGCALGAYADGLHAYESALSRMEHDVSRALVLLKAAEACEPLDEFMRGGVLAREAMATLDEAGEPVAAGRAAGQAGRFLLLTGELDDAITLTRDRFHALAVEPGAEGARARLGSVLCRALLNVGAPESEMPLLEVLRVAEQANEPRELARAVGVLGAIQMARGSLGVGRAVMGMQIELAREHGLWVSLAGAEMNLALTLVSDSLPQALALMRSAHQTEEAHGLSVRGSLANLATTLWLAGEWEEVDAAVQSLVEANVGSDAGFYVIARVVDAWREESGRDRLVEDLPDFTANDLNGQAWQALRQALASSAAGDHRTAVHHATIAVERSYQDAMLGDDFPHIWPCAVRLSIAGGDLAAAAGLLDRVGGHPGDPGHLLRAQLTALRGALASLTPGAEPEAVERDLTTGIEALERYGALPDRARTQEQLGRWLASQGRTDEALPHLEAARATYRRLGATSWEARLPASASATAAS